MPRYTHGVSPLIRSIFPCLVLAACAGGDAGGGGETRPNPLDPNSIPPSLRGDQFGSAVTSVSSDNRLEGLEDSAGVVLDTDDIVFTDPDAEDPEDILPELEQLLEEAPDEGPWRKSFTQTLREARHAGKPILIWFSDSQNSPPSRALGEELFNQRDFEAWASKHFVRLQVDSRVQGSKLDHDVANKADYIEGLKKRFRVFGTPTLLVLTEGENKVIGKYKGYRRGQADYKWGQLRQALALAEESQEQWKKRMEGRGYRDWTGPRGRSIFAKLQRYHDGRLILVEPDGHRFQTKERYLSPGDQDWIAEQKRRRGIQ